MTPPEDKKELVAECDRIEDTLGLGLTCAKDVQSKPINWLWKGYLACGKFHLLAGAPGSGKTKIALSLAAAVSNGGPFPDGSLCEPGEVLIHSYEDDVSDTLKPRLEALGARLEAIHFITGGPLKNGKRDSFNPLQNLAELRFTLAEPNIKMLIIDPITSFVSGRPNDDIAVRSSLQPIIETCSALGIALFGITHFAKGSQERSAPERVLGSTAYVALSRITLCVQLNNAEEERRWGVLTKVKSNNVRSGDGFEYELEEVQVAGNIDTSIIRWGKALKGSYEEILRLPIRAANDEDDGSGVAEWLRELLSNGPLPVSEVHSMAARAGYDDLEVKAARKALSVRSVKSREANGPWLWELPRKFESSHSSNSS
ncbi:MAG: AAA family ATPase [Betaproteobacteria bacterium]|nr:AAA family ATPase [Betaproteobacteria bacterium]